MCIYVIPAGPLHGPRAVDALIVEDIDRAAPLGTGSAKVGGNYGPMLGVVDRAVREGYGLTLHLDSKNHTAIDEFSTSAFVGVRTNEDQYTIVVSDSGQIVNSVTSDSVCEIAKTFGWRVERRVVSPFLIWLFEIRSPPRGGGSRSQPCPPCPSSGHASDRTPTA
jgi:branched-chain amino acid aminotransferase